MISKKILYLLVIVFTLIQCFILISFNKINTNEDLIFSDTYSISNIKNVKSIKEIISDFHNFSDFKILSYNKIEEGKWKLRCVSQGDKDKIIKNIERLDYYKIVSYRLNYENGDILLELELENK